MFKASKGRYPHDINYRRIEKNQTGTVPIKKLCILLSKSWPQYLKTKVIYCVYVAEHLQIILQMAFNANFFELILKKMSKLFTGKVLK